MRITALLPQFPLLQLTDGGVGGGSASSGQASSGGGSNTGAPTSGAPSGASSAPAGGNASTHLTLTPDSMVVLPGSNTPVKWGDFQSRHIPLDRHNADKASAVAAAIKAIAAANKNRRPVQNGQPQAQAQPQDIFADVRGLPIIDGQTLTTLAERIQREGVNPLYEWAGKVNTFLDGINKRLGATESVAGGYTEQQLAAQFDSKVKGVLGTVASKLLPGVDVSQHPVLNELAQDVYLSYNPNDPNLEREYPGMLESRLDGLLKLANALSVAKLQQAREARKNFLRPGGAGQPSGQGGSPRLSHRDIAHNYFANDAAART